MASQMLNLVLATFAVCSISSFQFAAVVSLNVLSDVLKPWINGTNIDRYGQPLDSSQVDGIWAVLIGFFFVGQLVGSLTVKPVARVFGRRNAILFASVFIMISHALSASSKFLKSWEVLMAARIMLGSGVSCTMAIGAMYLTEIPSVEYRGRCGSAIGVSLGLGEVFGGFIALPMVFGTETNWPLAVGVPGVVAILGVCAMLYLHDSPRYLYITKNDIPSAERAVTFFQSSSLDKLLCRMEELSVEKSLTAKKSRGIIDLFRDRSSRKMAIAAAAINCGIGFAGASGLISLSSTVLYEAGLSLRDAKLVTTGLGASFLVGSIISSTFVDKIGRRRCLILGWVGSLTSTIVVTIATGLATYGGIRNTALAWTCAAGMISFMLLFGIQEAVALFIAAELFPQESRDAAATLAGFVFSLACAIEGTIFPFLVEFAGITITFMPFVVVPLANLILALISLPETMGRTITDVTLTVDGEDETNESMLSTDRL